jgi:hypothetical protein
MDAGNYTGSLLWSNGSTAAGIHVTNTATYTVTQTVNGCTSDAGSGTSAPRTTPSAPVLSKLDNCDGTTTITAKDGQGNTIAAGELTWSNNELSGNPVTVSTTSAITATRTIDGCPSAASSAITPAPKTTPAAPVLSVVDNCNGTSTVTAKDGSGNTIPASQLTWSNAGTGNPITVTATTAITATRTVSGCTSSASNSVTPAPKTTPSAPILSKVDNCDGTTTITAKDASGTNIPSGELTWSNSETGNPITVTTTTVVTAIRTVNECPSAASNSITPAPKTKPGAPTVTVVNNCDGSSDLTASNYTGSLLWSNGSTTATIHVTNAAIYTVTQTVNGCTSAAGSGTSAPKSTPAAPVLVITQPSLCGPTTGSLEVCGPTAGYIYSIGNNAITAQASQPVKFENLAPGSNPAVKVTSSNGCEATTACSSALATCPTEGAKAITATNEQTSSQSSKTFDISARIGSKARVLAAPNPFTDRVRFTLESGVSGLGSLEIYNTMGQRIATVYQGYVEAGKVLVKEYIVPESRRANLIYEFRVGDQKTTGKLLNW